MSYQFAYLGSTVNSLNERMTGIEALLLKIQSNLEGQQISSDQYNGGSELLQGQLKVTAGGESESVKRSMTVLGQSGGDAGKLTREFAHPRRLEIPIFSGDDIITLTINMVIDKDGLLTHFHDIAGY